MEDQQLGEYHTVVYCIGDVGIPTGAGSGPALPLPSLTSFAPHLKKICCGKGHIVILLDTGIVYVCGDGDKGQLGLGTEDGQPLPVQLPSSLFPDADANFSVIDVAVGEEHTLALSSKGKVYCWGLGNAGQLGLGSLKSVNTPHVVKALEKFKVIKIAAGSHHSCALTNTGHVYTWGRGLEGQLAHGNFQLAHAPHLVSSIFQQKISNIVCAYNYSVFVTEIGRVYICGEGMHGVLGQGDTVTRNIACEVRLLDKDPTPRLTIDMLAKQQKGMGTLTVIDVGLGWSHVVFLDDGGMVYSNGLNAKGQLGYGTPTSKIRSPQHVDLLHTLPQPEQNKLLNEKVAEALALSDDGEMSLPEGAAGHSLGSDTSSHPTTVPSTAASPAPDKLTAAATTTVGQRTSTPMSMRTDGDGGDLTTPGDVSIVTRREKGADLNTGPQHMDKVRPAKVICGRFFSAALTESGHLYVWGSFGDYEFGKVPVYVNQQMPYETKVLSMWPHNDGAFLVVEEFIPFVPVGVNIRINSPTPPPDEELLQFVKTHVTHTTPGFVEFGRYQHAGTVIVLHGNTQSLMDSNAMQTILQSIIARLATKRVEFWHEFVGENTLILTIAAFVDFTATLPTTDELHGFELDVERCGLLGLVTVWARPGALQQLEQVIGEECEKQNALGQPLWTISDITLEQETEGEEEE